MDDSYNYDVEFDNHNKFFKKRPKKLPWNVDVPKDFFLQQPYQIKLVDIAIKNNILIFIRKQDLKNYLIIAILKEYSLKLEKNKKLILICNQIHAKNDYTDLISRHTTLKVAHELDMQSNLLILSITQLNEILKNDKNTIKLIIFDDLFLTLQNEMYKKAHNRIDHQKIHIIGMDILKITTQTKPSELTHKINSLKTLFKCDFVECATDLLDTNNQLNNFKLNEVIEVCDDFKQTHLSILLSSQLNQTLEFLCDIHIDKLDNNSSVEYIHLICIKIIKECLYLVSHIGIWCFTKSLLPFISQIDKLAHFFETKSDCQMEKCMLRFVATQLRTYREQSMRELTNFKQEYPKRSESRCDALVNRFCTPKFKALFDLLKRNSIKNDKFCALVYVDNKQTAVTLSLLLKKLSHDEPKLNYLNQNYIINSLASSESVELSEEHSVPFENLKQEEIIRKFHSGRINLLICTHEIEELINIPNNCSLIIHFDVDNFNYTSYILAKSRLKVDTEPGKIVFLCEKSDFDGFLSCYSNVKEIEYILSEKYSLILSNKFNLTTQSSLEVSPQIIEMSKLNGKNSIELLNRYCIRLPSDSLTQLTENYQIERCQSLGMFKCKVRLPVNSAYRDIISSEWCESLIESMEKCAQKACLLLQEQKELNDNFDTITKEQFCKKQYPFDSFDISEWTSFKSSKQANDVNARPGDTKRKQIYGKKISSYLNDSLLSTTQTCYLYVFKFSLAKSLLKEKSVECSRVEERYFGLISHKFMLEIPDYSIFTTNGEENVEFKLVKNGLYLTQNQVQLIKNFHQFLFSNVLRMQRPPVHFESMSPGAYVCLVLEKEFNFDIDWKLIKTFDGIEDFKQPLNGVLNENFQFEPDLYEDSVVMPYYRMSDNLPQYYCVEAIDYEMNPLSKFPSNNVNYSTFHDYYLNKYNQIITNAAQPMLVVTHPSTRLNLLTPRYMNPKASVLQKSFNPSKSTSNKIYLVPELVKVHPFSAALWKRSLCLPSVLYRLNSLLLAEELRREIAQSTGVGVPWSLETHKFEKLEFHWDAKKEIEILHLPDIEVDLTNKMDNNNHGEKLSSLELNSNCNWDFEISTWDDSCLKQFKSPNQTLHKVASQQNGWHDVLGDNKTLLIDINDMSFFNDNPYNGDDYDSGGEDLEQEHDQSWIQVVEDSKRKSDFLNSNNIHNVNEANREETHQISSKFSINLNNLKNDLKQKSAKLLSKLNVSSSEMKHFLVDETKKDQEDEEIDLNEFEILEYIKDRGKEGAFNSYDCNLQSIIHSESTWLKRTSIDVSISSEENTKIFEIKSKLDSMRAEFSQDSVHNYDFLDKLNLINIRDYSYNLDKRLYGCLNNQELPFSFGLDYKSFGENENLGPGPSILLQALTLTNAGDGFDLERLETVGDSFLKQAITVYLFFKYPKVNEGKLSYLRSKQVSNYNLYKLGKQKSLGDLILSSKFEPLDAWLPLHYDIKHNQSLDEILTTALRKYLGKTSISKTNGESKQNNFNKYLHHVVSDKSIADCVEAIIGAYLISSGSQGALRIMNWFGLEVLPKVKSDDGSELYVDEVTLVEPTIKNPGQLEYFTADFNEFEEKIGYRFRNRAYLLQAFTHASYYFNEITDCYQRLEFLGDAVLDYLITRYLYEDAKRHSPGELTDLRSSLVNNNIFAHLAVKFEFYKYFKYLSPTIFSIVDNYVKNFNENHLDEELIEYFYEDDDDEFMESNGKEDLADDYEESEVPKCLGDIFESVAGAIYLDSNKSFDAVWRVYYALMKSYIDKYTNKVPKSPIRELLELEPETVKFETPERTIDGKIRVTVSVFGKGKFKGIGRNYRIAKSSAAKSALKYIKKEYL